VLAAIAAAELGEAEHAIYLVAEGPKSMLSSYFGAKDWQKYKGRFPDFARGHYRCFEALAKKSETKAVDAAWTVVALDIQLDGEIETARRAAQLLVEKNGEKRHGRDPRWPAVVAMAEEAPCGRKWLRAAEAMEKKHPAEAYAAYKNAAYWFNAEMQQCPSITWRGGKRCAEALGDENLLALFRELKAPKDEDVEELLAQYDEVEAPKEAKPARSSKAAEALLEAVQSCDAAGVKSALAAGADVDAQTRDKESALHLAAGTGDAKIIRLLLEHGADPKIEDIFHGTPLVALLMSYDEADGNAEVVHELARAFIERGANVNATDSNKGSALHWAASQSLHETVELLLARGADPKAEDDDGDTPLTRTVGKRARREKRLGAAGCAGLDRVIALLRKA
jgi:hypothetical protein